VVFPHSSIVILLADTVKVLRDARQSDQFIRLEGQAACRVSLDDQFPVHPKRRLDESQWMLSQVEYRYHVFDIRVVWPWCAVINCLAYTLGIAFTSSLVSALPEDLVSRKMYHVWRGMRLLQHPATRIETR
jgi:hypothetical protein